MRANPTLKIRSGLLLCCGFGFLWLTLLAAASANARPQEAAAKSVPAQSSANLENPASQEAGGETAVPGGSANGDPSTETIPQWQVNEVVDFFVRPLIEIPLYAGKQVMRSIRSFSTNEQVREAAELTDTVLNQKKSAGPPPLQSSSVGTSDSANAATGAPSAYTPTSPPTGSLSTDSLAVDTQVSADHLEYLDANPSPRLASRHRAIRALRLIVFFSGLLLAMIVAKSMLQLNHLSHGSYAGRLQWFAWIAVTLILILAIALAWNESLWQPLLREL